MASVKELLERVRVATGPDRNLDAMLHHWALDGVGTGAYSDSPAYTASIDAALALTERLLPGSMRRVFDNPDDGSVRAEIVAVSGQVARSDHDTWSLAIIVALLALLSSLSKEGNEP